MSRYTHSDICYHVVFLGDVDLAWKDVDLSHEWFMVYEAVSSGQRKQIISNAYAKILEGRLYSIHLVNSSPYDGRYQWTVFAEFDQKAIIRDKNDGIFNLGELLPDASGVSPASGLESVELFLKDYGFQNLIHPMAAVNQTL